MAKAVRISLANKCQLLFGAAVVLILTAALAVVWLRLQNLAELGPLKRARDFTEAWLADWIQLGGGFTRVQNTPPRLAPGQEMSLALIRKEDFETAGTKDAFLSASLDRFFTDDERTDRFDTARDEQDKPYYRYARAIRKRDLSRMRGGAGVGLHAEVDASALANPVEMVLLLNLRDDEARRQLVLNRVYIVAAGLFAGLLAIAVFWFITTRLILSPVRVLRDTAEKVSEGDLNIRADINTGDEFEQLSDMFNTMLANLKQNQDQLRSINKSLDLKLGELAETNVALYEANKMKGEFLANVSHELRTPLNSIIGFAEVLEETLKDRTGPIDEKRKRYTSNIITSSRRLLDLITDLLDLAKIEAGRMDVHVSQVSVADTCEGLVNLIRPQAEKRRVTLKMRLATNIPVVQTDPGKFGQVLFNFLSNAVKFTPSGGTVTVSAEPASIPWPGPPAAVGQVNAVRVSVSDTGPGIPIDQHDRVFEKFTQLDPSVTKEHGGTGLGLTISRELASLLNARIELDSDAGKGATFSLVLPLMLTDHSAPLMPDLASPGRPLRTPFSTPRNG